MAETRNPGALAGATGARECDRLGSLIDPDHTETIASAQARRIADRFGLPHPHARVIARHAFGECAA